jgi:hypothetical protein
MKLLMLKMVLRARYIDRSLGIAEMRGYGRCANERHVLRHKQVKNKKSEVGGPEGPLVWSRLWLVHQTSA